MQQVHARDARVAFGGLEQAAQHTEGGGFARAVRAQQAVDFAGVHFEVDVIRGDEGAEAFGEAAAGDERFARVVRRSMATAGGD